MATAYDQTGVGRAVVDMFRDGGVPVRALTITAGTNVTRDAQDVRVPKRELVGVVQVLLQTQRLQIAKRLPFAQLLVDELLAFKVNFNQRGHATYGNDVGSWREAEHDDMVLATAMPAWWGESTGLPLLTGPSRVRVNSHY